MKIIEDALIGLSSNEIIYIINMLKEMKEEAEQMLCPEKERTEEE